MRNVRFAFATDGNQHYSDKNFSRSDFFQIYEYQVENLELKRLNSNSGSTAIAGGEKEIHLS